MASTNFARAARVRETIKGTTPNNPAFAYIYATALGLAPNDPFGRSETIVGDRGIREHLRLGAGVAGNYSLELSGGASDFALELALFDDFAGFPEAYNVTADSTITNVVSGTQTMTAAGAWVAGMVIETSGFSTAGNNKEFRAAAGTGAGTIVAPAGTFTADESAPPAGARALARGIEGAAGDLVTAADGITSTTLDFSLFPIAAWSIVRITGFDDARADVVATVVSVAAHKVTLTDLPADWATGLGAGKTVRLYVAEMIENKDLVKTETHKIWNTKTSPIAYETFKGVAANTLGLPFALNSIIKPTLGLVGFRGGVSEALESGATFADPAIGVTGQAIKTGDNIARLVEGGASVGVPACCQSLNLNITNNLQNVGCLTSDAPVDYNEGDFECVIESEWRYRDKNLMEKFYSGATSAVLVAAMRGQWGYAVRVHNGVYTGAGAPTQGRNQEHVLRMRFEAQKHATSGKTVSIGRFRKYL